MNDSEENPVKLVQRQSETLLAVSFCVSCFKQEALPNQSARSKELLKVSIAFLFTLHLILCFLVSRLSRKHVTYHT